MKVTKVKQIILILLLVSICISWLANAFGLVKLAQSKVAIVQSAQQTAAQIDYAEIKALVTQAVDMAGGFTGIIKNGDTVVIKPNLVIGMTTTGGTLEPECNGITTDWRVTKAIVELVREVNPAGRVLIMEGSAYPTAPIMENMHYTPEYITGVDEFIAIETDSGGWLEYSSPNLVNVELPDGLLRTSYYLNRKYYDADVIISVPTLKNHSTACITGSLKNTGIGATPANIYGNSASDHLRLNTISHYSSGVIHKWIHDFYLCKPINFVIFDGLQGFQNGPGQIGTKNVAAEQMNMRLIMAGRDAVATDTIAALLVGWDPDSVQHLTLLNASGAGNIDRSCITVAGKRVDEVRKRFAGYRPSAGGQQIADTTPPTLAIVSTAVSGNTLTVSLQASTDTIKAELYVDGVLQDNIATSGYDSLSYNIAGLAGGVYEAVVHTYDNMLNHAEAAFTFTSTSALTPAPTGRTPTRTYSSQLMGDVNGDGAVTIVDALMTARYSVGIIPAGFNSAVADVNRDSTINIVDALTIAQYYVGLIPGF